MGASAALSSCNNEEFLATTQFDILDANAMFENDYNEQKMDMPIPAGELAKNKLCDQNPGY